ncbi:cytochrome P450 [Amycolatopsis stemonae]
MTPCTTALFAENYWNQSLAVADALRPQASVHRATLPNQVRVWVISQYDDARAALSDPRLSKDNAGLTAIIRDQLAEAGQEADLSNMFAPHMMFNDDPAHARLRALVAAKFTRGRVRAMRPWIEQLTTAVLDELPVDRPVDLIDTVAFPLPLNVICQLLGVPLDDREYLREWTAALMEDLPERALPASRKMERYFDRLITARRAVPGDDLLSALVQTSEHGDQLSPPELMGTLFLLFVAGHETTTNLIGNTVRHLLAEPSRWRRLAGEPGLVPAAIEESLRYDSPVRMATHRFTTEDVEYGGVVIPAGEIVLVWLQSANRDDSRFPRATDLVLGRADAAAHLSFGHGIHYCLGAPLGRMEAEIVLHALTQRFPNARLAASAHELQRRPSAIMNGYVGLPVRLGG